MERRILVILLIVLVGGLVFAAEGGWGDFETVGSDDGGVINSLKESEEPIETIKESGETGQIMQKISKTGDSTYYTSQYFIALSLGALVVFIIALLFYFLFKRPKNRWE